VLNELRKNRSPDCISDLEFDEWASDELSADDARRLEAHVASCEVCGGRRAELALLAQQFLQDAPRLREAPAAPERERAPGARSRPRALPWNPRVAALSVAACGTALALFLGVFSPGDRGVRSKGGPHLGFYV
jgi:anti-sigma factor RsiW